MSKRISTLLGIGLLVLWIVGLGSPGAISWLTWMDGIAALCAFGMSAFTPDYASKSTRMGQPIVLAAGLFALWLIALATDVPSALTWWNFIFASAFLALGIFNGAERRPPLMEGATTNLTRERERRRKSA